MMGMLAAKVQQASLTLFFDLASTYQLETFCTIFIERQDPASHTKSGSPQSDSN